MGGTVAVTLRLPDGRDYRMARWTNSLPHYINNIQMINKDPVHLQEYLSSWLAWEKDWQDNHRTKKFRHDATECYMADSYTLAPIGYGLVVIDCVKNYILHSQGYTALGNFNGVTLCLRDQDDIDRFVALRDNGKLKSIHTWNRDLDAEELTLKDVEKMSIEELLEQPTLSETTFEIDMSPFQVIRYEDYDKTSWKEMQTKILELGFTLSDRELKAWKQAFKEC